MPYKDVGLVHPGDVSELIAALASLVTVNTVLGSNTWAASGTSWKAGARIGLVPVRSTSGWRASEDVPRDHLARDI